ncbi:MAG: PKD domain-containing protein, partial [candidate division KSB1 bacterium]|nr:PKD domain-containing protein [candidate division KSB1 bacterium]
NYAAKFLNSHGQIDQLVDVEPNQNYKLTFWVYLDPAFSGDDWGGVLCSVVDYNWNQLGASIFINPNNRPKGKWLSFAVSFNTGSANVVRVQIGFFGGSGWNAVFYIDEVKLFKKSAVNLPPDLLSFTASPTSGTAPLTVSFSLSAADADGVIESYVIQPGDGSFYENDQAVHTYALPGTYTATATVRDDDNGVDTESVIINVAGPSSFSIQMTSPFQGDYYQTDAASLLLTGTCSESVPELFWFNEKNHQSGFAALNGTQFSFTTPLQYGRNDVILQAKRVNNEFYKKEITIVRMPAGYSGPILGTVNFSSRNVQTFAKIEITFELNSIADNYWFPYDPSPPPNLNSGTGVSVDCIFTKGNRTWTFPAFYDMPYQRFDDYLLPTGEFIWKVRASLPEAGTYSVTLRAQDQGGTRFYDLGTVTAAASNNKGYLQVSQNNNRFFEYSDGSPFYGLGFGDGPDTPRNTDNKIEAYAQNGVSLLRVWLSPVSQFSDPWCAWTTHHQMPDNGYMNPPLYRFNRRYKNGDFSIRLAAPAVPNVNAPAAFRGLYDGGTVIKPNTTYRITVRVKLENVTGNGGFSLKTAGWGGTEIVNPNVGTRLLGPIKGTTDWLLLTANYTSGAGERELPNLYAVLEGSVTGEAYIDMILLQEVLPDGRLKQNIMSKWSANPHYYFDPIKVRYFDYMIEQATLRNVHYKIVILEKGDYILNHIDPSGLPSDFNGDFDAPPNTKLRRLYEYYWRNLIARWGYSDAVHSFELVNEGAPGSYFNLVNDFNDFFETVSPRPIMTTTSFWADWVPNYWNQSRCDYGDVHAYVINTGFIDSGVFLGQTYNRQQMQQDPAAMIYIYSKRIGDDPLRNKPVVLGETDLDTPAGQASDPALAQDTAGIWLRGFLWGHLNTGGVTGLIWDPINIRNHNLYPLYKPVSAFLSQIPFNRYSFRDAQVTITNPDVRGWGVAQQNDGAVYFYAAHRNLRWRYVLDNGMPPAVTTSFVVRRLAPGMQKVTFFSTQTGEIQNLSIHYVGSDSTLALNDIVINPDIAFSLTPTNVIDVLDKKESTFDFDVSDVYPNPSNHSVSLRLTMPHHGDVVLQLYDLLGRKIDQKIFRGLAPGNHDLTLDGNELASGVYFMVIEAGSLQQTKKFSIVK